MKDSDEDSALAQKKGEITAGLKSWKRRQEGVEERQYTRGTPEDLSIDQNRQNTLRVSGRSRQRRRRKNN